MLHKLAIQYHHDSAVLFEPIAHQLYAILLDSGQAINPATDKAGSQYGRYDILVAEPFITLLNHKNKTEITQDGKLSISEANPFVILNNLLKQYPVAKSDLPFTGGAVGYFAYDLGRSIEKLPQTAAPSQDIADMLIGFYDWAVVVDHREKRSYLVSNCLHKSTEKKLPSLQILFNAAIRVTPVATDNPFKVTSMVKSNLSATQYAHAFKQVKAYIDAGDCYQVNLAQRFSAHVQGDSWQAYKKLRQISPAPFMAFMRMHASNGENVDVLCNSPERFLQTDGSHVETRPIKGTRPRSSDAKQDLANANELLNSAKDKAENVMIVDLLRNDLGKNCEIGSVKTTKLFQLQSFANVHHLVSIVVGKIKQGANAVDILRGSFPGGSITGAPKLRAMQIIEALEPHRRGLYCGAIGYIGFDGQMDTNIAIRTATIAQGYLTYYAGGGIVADSDEQKEYTETFDKASNFTKITTLYTRL